MGMATLINAPLSLLQSVLYNLVLQTNDFSTMNFILAGVTATFAMIPVIIFFSWRQTNQQNVISTASAYETEKKTSL